MNAFHKLVLLTLSILFSIVFSPSSANASWQPKEGVELIGRPAPELIRLKWLNSRPLRLADLRGKVVLIRFWLIDCLYCQRTAPALNYLLGKYEKKGLVVIGIHHPKSKAAQEESLVRKGAEELKFKFPLAMDNDWATLNAYWLGERKRAFTSASFLLDKHGIIRWVHPGGDIILLENGAEPKASAFSSLEQTINDLLSEE